MHIANDRSINHDARVQTLAQTLLLLNATYSFWTTCPHMASDIDETLSALDSLERDVEVIANEGAPGGDELCTDSSWNCQELQIMYYLTPTCY